MNRLFKEGIVTTIFGCICIGGAIYMYMSKQFEATEAAELGALGLVFLRSKDSLIGLSAKKE